MLGARARAIYSAQLRAAGAGGTRRRRLRTWGRGAAKHAPLSTPTPGAGAARHMSPCRTHRSALRARTARVQAAQRATSTPPPRRASERRQDATPCSATAASRLYIASGQRARCAAARRAASARRRRRRADSTAATCGLRSQRLQQCSGRSQPPAAPKYPSTGRKRASAA